MTIMNAIKNLTKESPRSPRNRLGGYALMARMIDKGRAEIEGTAGDYHFNCPLDQSLFEFKGVKAEEVRKLLGSGATDEQVVDWFNTHGTKKTPQEIKEWSTKVEETRPFTDPGYADPEKRAWFSGECARLGLNPEQTTLVEYLEKDDTATFDK